MKYSWSNITKWLWDSSFKAKKWKNASIYEHRGPVESLLWLNREDVFHWYKQLVLGTCLIYLWARSVCVLGVRKLTRKRWLLFNCLRWSHEVGLTPWCRGAVRSVQYFPITSHCVGCFALQQWQCMDLPSFPLSSLMWFIVWSHK